MKGTTKSEIKTLIEERVNWLEKRRKEITKYIKGNMDRMTISQTQEQYNNLAVINARLQEAALIFSMVVWKE